MSLMNNVHNQKKPYSNEIPSEESVVFRQDADDVDADGVLYIDRNHIDTYAMNVVSALSKTDVVTIRSKGRHIPTAVTVANIVLYEVLKTTSRVRKILLDTDAEPGIGHMTSIIEIQLEKK